MEDLIISVMLHRSAIEWGENYAHCRILDFTGVLRIWLVLWDEYYTHPFLKLNFETKQS